MGGSCDRLSRPRRAGQPGRPAAEDRGGSRRAEAGRVRWPQTARRAMAAYSSPHPNGSQRFVQPFVDCGHSGLERGHVPRPVDQHEPLRLGEQVPQRQRPGVPRVLLVAPAVEEQRRRPAIGGEVDVARLRERGLQELVDPTASARSLAGDAYPRTTPPQRLGGTHRDAIGSLTRRRSAARTSSRGVTGAPRGAS